MQALQELETRFDAARLHVTGYSMGGWMQTARLGDGFRSIYHGLGHLFDLIDPTMVVQLPSGKHRRSYWTWPFIVSFPIKNGDFP